MKEQGEQADVKRGRVRVSELDVEHRRSLDSAREELRLDVLLDPLQGFGALMFRHRFRNCRYCASRLRWLRLRLRLRLMLGLSLCLLKIFSDQFFRVLVVLESIDEGMILEINIKKRSDIERGHYVENLFMEKIIHTRRAVLL